MEVITTYELICYFLIASAFFTFFSLFWITAPYGRHERTRWGLSLPNSWGWVLMESPGVVMFSAVFFEMEFRSQKQPFSLLSVVWALLL